MLVLSIGLGKKHLNAIPLLFKFGLLSLDRVNATLKKLVEVALAHVVAGKLLSVVWS